MAYKERTHMVVLDYTTERIEDFNVHGWERYAMAKLGVGLACKVTGARCFKAPVWHGPKTFSHGKGCLKRVQQAMRDGFVELRVTYKD